MARYNQTRFIEELLERNKSQPPSFSVHLHPEYWTLNGGSKFLYNNQIASLLDDIRAHRIPVDFLELFDRAGVRYYDGCMIVELLDYRPQKPSDPVLEDPERTRTVLHPNSETLWADMCLMNAKYGGKWTDMDALEVEARILLSTSAPLCLDPDPHLTRIVNNVIRVSTPTVPMSLKRKAAALDPEEDETERARRLKIMQFMNPRLNRAHTPSYRILDVKKQFEEEKKKAPPPPPATAPSQSAPARTPSQTPAPAPQVPAFVTSARSSNSSSPAPPHASTPYTQAHSPASSEDSKRKLKPRAPDTQPMTFVVSRTNGSQTPVSASTTQFNQNSNSHHSPSPQPHVYPNAQAAIEASKRVPTPAQQYTQSPRAPSIQPHPPSQTNQQQHATPQQTVQHIQQSPRLSQPPQSQHPSQAQTTEPQAQQTQQPSQPNQPVAQGLRQTTTPVPTFQPPIPAANFLRSAPGGRNIQANATNGIPVTMQAQQISYNPQHQSHLQQQAHMMMQQRLAQQQAQQNGRSTPHQIQSPMNSHAAAVGAGRGSPMAANARLASRSPMPPQNMNGNVSSPRPPIAGSPRIMPQGSHFVPTAYNTQFRTMVHPGNAATHNQQAVTVQAQNQAQAQARAAASASPAPVGNTGDGQGGQNTQGSGQVMQNQQQHMQRPQQSQTSQVQHQQLPQQQQQPQSQAQAQSQAHAGGQQAYQMFAAYSHQMPPGFAGARYPPAFWPPMGMGRGVVPVNGQQGMVMQQQQQLMQAHLAMAQGKAVPGGMQGR